MKIVAGLLLLVSINAQAATELPFHAPDSVIFLTKNTNNNQVHYGVELDEQCLPIGRSPVYAYWRMLEKGERETSKLMFWERPGYGVRQPQEMELGENSAKFEFFIRGVPEQKIRIETFAVKSDHCGARAFTLMNDREALFQRIDINVSGWANIHRVEIHGIDAQTLDPLTEVTLEE